MVKTSKVTHCRRTFYEPIQYTIYHPAYSDGLVYQVFSSGELFLTKMLWKIVKYGSKLKENGNIWKLG